MAAVVLAAGMMFAGAGTAVADETAGQVPPASQSSAGQSDADVKADGQTDTKTDAPADPKTDTKADADQKADAQPDAKADADKKADTKADAKADVKQSAPQAAPQAAAAGPAIASVTAPEGKLLISENSLFRDASSYPKFQVALIGLTPGKLYGLEMNSCDNGSCSYPEQGDTDSIRTYNGVSFTADQSEQTVTLPADIYTATNRFVLVEDADGQLSDQQVDGTVVAVLDQTFDVVNLDGKIKLSNQRVEDVGVHSAGLKADYSIDPELMSQVKSVCYTTTIVRVNSVTGDKDTYNHVSAGAGARVVWDCVTGSVSDDDPASSEIMKVKNLVASDNGKRQILGQRWDHGYTYKNTADKPLAASGTVTQTLTGLQAGTRYGNWGPNNQWDTGSALIDLGDSGVTGTDLLGQMYSGLTVTFTDGSQYVPRYWPDFDDVPASILNVPDFTTQAFAAKPGSDLTDGNRNGVTGANNGQATAGSPYRLYVDSLKESAQCKALVAKGEYCYWTGYIYSSPKQLMSPDGKSSAVRVDDQGRAYVEYVIPSDYSGAHKIAVYDGDTLLGWAPVTVGAAQGKPAGTKPASKKSSVKLAKTGAGVSVVVAAVVVLAVAGAGALVLRKRQSAR